MEAVGGTAEAAPCYKTPSIAPLSLYLSKMDNHPLKIKRTRNFR
jgi:hypothetical protein